MACAAACQQRWLRHRKKRSLKAWARAAILEVKQLKAKGNLFFMSCCLNVPSLESVSFYAWKTNGVSALWGRRWSSMQIEHRNSSHYLFSRFCTISRANITLRFSVFVSLLKSQKEHFVLWQNAYCIFIFSFKVKTHTHTHIPYFAKAPFREMQEIREVIEGHESKWSDEKWLPLLKRNMKITLH